MQELYQGLMTAVVIQAATDYVTYKWKAVNAKTAPARKDAADEVRRLEEFFLSDRFVLYTNVSGREFLRAIKRMPPRPSKRGRGSNKHVW